MAKVLSDIEIAQQTKLEPIVDIAKKVGLTEDDLELYGKYKAKISFDAIKSCLLYTSPSPRDS